MRSVFFGSPSFAGQTLDALLDASVEICGIVTQPPRPKGRSSRPQPTPVAEIAARRLPGIPLLEPARLSEPGIGEQLAGLDADLFLVVAYGGILGQRILTLPKVACLNVHPSLLPRYRGAAPIQHALMNGDVETGVCIMHLVRELDAGDIVSRTTLPIGPDEGFPELDERLRVAGAKLLLEALEAIEAGRAERWPQNPLLVSFAPKITPMDRRLVWTRPAQELHNRIRALSPNPGAFCCIEIDGQGRRLKILESRVVDGEGEAGERLFNESTDLVVACGRDALGVLRVQPEGKAAMAASDFLRGLPTPPSRFI